MRNWLVLLLGVFVLCAVPTFAEDQKGPRGLVTFGGGVLKDTGDPAEKHLYLGGGGSVYPLRVFVHRNGFVAKRFAVGVEIGRAVFGNSEKYVDFDQYVGEFLARNRFSATFLSPQARFDVAPVGWKYVRIAVHGGYTGFRSVVTEQALVGINIFGKEKWQSLGTVGSQWSGTANYGLSVAFAIPNRKYNDKVVGTSWAFPVKYTRYANGLDSVTVGLERYF